MTRDDVQREAVHEEFGSAPGRPSTDHMADEIVRLRATLAVLREPSEAVVDAAGDAYTDALEGSEEGRRLLHALADSNSYAAICDYEWVRVAIGAAVAAAEKEAQGE